MRKLVKVLLGIVIVLGLFWAVINIIPPYKVIENNPFRKGETTLISAHRGGSILNPENTEKAFDYVILETSYTDIVEIDVQTTKDGELVIIHDGTINETGKIIESKKSIYSDMTTIEDMEITLAENSNITYKVVFYDEDENFISMTESVETDFDTTANPENAEYFELFVQ